MSLIRPVLLALLLSATAAFGQSQVMKWKIDGVEREALVFPPAQPSTAEVPLLFVFHPHGGTAKKIMERMKLPTAWPEALVVSMQGVRSPGVLGDLEGMQSGWQFAPGQFGDRDLKFFDAALAGVKESFPVDPKRIFAIGASNAGFFTYLLSAQRPDVFRAVAAGACKILPEVTITKPLAVFHFAASEDMRVLLREQEATIAAFRKINDCASEGETDGAGLTRYACAQGTPVQAFVFQGSHANFDPALEPALKFLKEQAALP